MSVIHVEIRGTELFTECEMSSESSNHREQSFHCNFLRQFCECKKSERTAR